MDLVIIGVKIVNHSKKYSLFKDFKHFEKCLKPETKLH